jgi:hypothetical protein
VTDRELAAGLLLAERVVRGAADLGLIAHCGDAFDIYALPERVP